MPGMFDTDLRYMRNTTDMAAEDMQNFFVGE